MKKFVKMSLVAALAVAGTTASAQPLAEAIQNVDVSGTVVYRYDDRATDVVGANTDNVASNTYKVGVSLSSKVNDDVKFNSRITVNDAFDGFDTAADADESVDLTLTQANFAYTGIANTTVSIGKLGLQTPWTNAVDSDGSEQTGTGILAMTTMGPVTGALGYINQHNIGTGSLEQAIGGVAAGTAAAIGLPAAEIGARDLLVAALIAKFGPVNLQAWYLDHSETFDSQFYKADASFNIDDIKVGVYAQHNDLELDSNVYTDTGITTGNDFSLTKVGATANMGVFSAGIHYGKTGDSGSGVLNNVAGNTMIGYTATLAATENADMWQYDLAMQVTPELNVALNYDQVKDDDANQADDRTETYVQITYNMSKNLSTYLRLADGEQGATDTDYNRGRVQVEYKF